MTDGAKGEPRNPASVYAAAVEGTQASAYRLSGDSSWPRPASPLPADEGLVSVPERAHRVEDEREVSGVNDVEELETIRRYLEDSRK